jgi:(2Fe-2S) ferredoxin
MEQARVPFQKILFVCVNRREPGQTCCAHRESEAVAAALKARVKTLGVSRHVRVSKSGCQDLCAKGPNVMVFPDNVWYHGVKLDDVEHIIEHATRGLTP